MSTSFQLLGLPRAPFDHLFDLSDAALRAMGAVRRVAEVDAAYPCRISLCDAAKGDELLLLPFTHQEANSPYHASGPIFVRRHADTARLPPGEVPPYVTKRLISARGYDAAHMIVTAAVCEGPDTRQAIEAMFDDARVAYIHLHNAKRGCFSCSVVRL